MLLNLLGNYMLYCRPKPKYLCIAIILLQQFILVRPILCSWIWDKKFRLREISGFSFLIYILRVEQCATVLPSSPVKMHHYITPTNWFRTEFVKRYWCQAFVDSGFSQTHKIDNIGIIANFVFPYICSFLLP